MLVVTRRVFLNFYKSVSDRFSVENFRQICVRQKIPTDFFGAGIPLPTKQFRWKFRRKGRFSYKKGLRQQVLLETGFPTEFRVFPTEFFRRKWPVF